ncbi:MAG TPA: hypothetical protein VGT60_11465 [Candidatus Limnocylindria bacterium]|nr:hypothetical protein [Candidatus Limnocylindria bacterium]
MSALGWVLGTFHTAAVGLALLVLAYPGGGLGVALASLSTITGLALFIALWGITVFATSRSIRGLDLVGGAAAGYHRRALRWGALNGLLFLWSLAALLALQQLITAPGTLQPQSLLLGAGFVGGLGSLFALAVGAVVGLALASIDLAGLALARWMA